MKRIETRHFCIGNQDDLLISDKHSRVYQESDKKQKDKL